MSPFGNICSEPCKSEPENSLLWSFDIFDTLLARSQTGPSDRFRAAYTKISLGDLSLDELTQLRVRGEIHASKHLGADLYSLDDIYSEMSVLDARFLPGKERAKKAELEMEREQCFGISQGRALWEKAKNTSRVIYTSDMYLPPAFLQELLERNGLWAPGARIFVSHAAGCAKHSGLFDKICQEMKIKPGQLVHVGDHPRSDIQAARKSGIRTLFISPGEDTRYEKRLRKAGLGNLADAIRAARLRFPGSPGSAEETLWETACGVAAPLFIAYVVWVRQRAWAMGLRKLFFVSRDGLIFKKIYDQLPPQNLGEPASHYLYGSRQAWICARLVRLDPEDISFLVLPNPTLSLNQLARRCNLEPDELGCPPGDSPGHLGEKALDGGQTEWICDQIRRGAWREKIQQRAEQRLAETRSYFRQEGVGKEPFALVDLGWFGNLQEYVANMLPETPPQHGFYLELRKTPRIQRENRASAFLDSSKVYGIDSTTSVTLLEVLATAPHGSCRGYRFRNGRWEPDLEKEPEFFLDSGAIERQHVAILTVLSNLIRLEPDLGTLPMEIWRQEAQKNFISLLKNPSVLEAEALGSAKFVSRQEGGHGVEFGPACGLAMAWQALVKGFRIREAAWPQAMIRRSHGLSRFFLALRYGITQGRAHAEHFFRS